MGYALFFRPATHTKCMALVREEYARGERSPPVLKVGFRVSNRWMDSARTARATRSHPCFSIQHTPEPASSRLPTGGKLCLVIFICLECSGKLCLQVPHGTAYSPQTPFATAPPPNSSSTVPNEGQAGENRNLNPCARCKNQKKRVRSFFSFGR